MKQKRKGNKQLKTAARLKSVLKGKGGITLIELIVTFALISLFAVSCTQIISKSIGVYHKIRGLNYALQVSDTLMEKITGEIEGAWNVPLNKESGDSTAIRITDNADMIELTDRTESHICITTTEKKESIPDYEATSGTYAVNQLLIYYYSVKGQTAGEDGYDPVDWTYDEAVYMDFSVKSLTFEQPALTESADYAKNIIKVTMELSSDKYGTFKSERYVHCYNFDDEQDAENIKSNGNGSGPGGGEGGGTDVPEEPEKPETNLGFEVEDVPFIADGDLQQIYEEANKEYIDKNPTSPPLSGVSVPQTGFYKVGDEYYYAVVSAWYSNGKLGSFSVKINREKILDYTSLVNVTNPDNKYWISKPSVGEVVLYNKEYYLVIGDGISPWSTPDSLNNWVKLNPRL